MSKTVIRYFLDFTDKQEKWLNKMAARGFRLVRCRRLTYGFEPCAPGEYQYGVEFAGEKSHAKLTDYKNFLEGLGYRVQYKSVNLNRSAGKVRFRPWADGAGKLAASPGAYNRELLIVEKKNDGKPFQLHTDARDAAAFFGTLRNAYLFGSLVGIIFAALFAVSELTALRFTRGLLPAWCGGVLFGLLGVVFVFLAVKYALIARRYKELGKTNE